MKRMFILIQIRRMTWPVKSSC
uniref:Uncharacterized protein n=1 Tax=Anguilla anguilla TaxID=7936 RepID=A0A0E9V2Z6_ANGAN